LVEEQIIKLFCEDKYIFTKYYKYVNINYIKVNYSNLYKLFITIDNYYNKYNNNNNINKQELELVYNSNYLLKDSERKELTELINRILDNEVSNKETVIGLLEEHRRRCLAGEVARTALDVEDGKASIESLLALFNDFEHQEVEATEAKAIQFDLRKLHETQVATPGLRWRLNFLNKSLGSLRQGDFGFIFARPETGKTTFLASEISKMIQQTDGEIIWFNNEEQGNKVAIRCYQAVLGVTAEKLFSNLDMYQKQFEDMVQNRIKIYDFEDSSRASRVEAILKESKPALIIFDQIDKIKGFKGDRNDLELKAIYQWAREIAKTYAPVIGVSQAGGEAEGKLWLTMDMVDGSKTAKQGEADWILGIGKEQDNTSRTRYLNITKNKLLGDSDTLPEMRHGSAQVLIKPEIARYEDL
jgi:KaiC/GvpD/RAD55 family RecA-like ATPase